MIVRKDPGSTRVYLWCPACEGLHAVGTGPNGWEFNDDTERPTLSPSLLVRGHQWPADNPFHKPKHQVEPGGQTVCHSFVIAGQWQFLSDCTHTLAGQIVPCVPIPDGLFEDRSHDTEEN